MPRKPINPVDAHVGSRVRLRRSLLGMSQEQLGASLGLTFQQIQKYEKGANRISAGRLLKVADLLGVSVQFFYDDMPPGLAPGGAPAAPGFSEEGAIAPFAHAMTTPEGVDLSRAFARIGDLAVRRRVVELVQAIADDRAPETAPERLGAPPKA